MNEYANTKSQGIGGLGQATAPVSIWQEAAERWRLAREGLERATHHAEEANGAHRAAEHHEAEAWGALLDVSGRGPTPATSVKVPYQGPRDR